MPRRKKIESENVQQEQPASQLLTRLRALTRDTNSLLALDKAIADSHAEGSLALAVVRAERYLEPAIRAGGVIFAAGEIQGLRIARVNVIATIPKCPHCGAEAREWAFVLSAEELEASGFKTRAVACDKCGKERPVAWTETLL